MKNRTMIETVESPYIRAANTENFTALVLDNSQQGPVLVNFWSRKAGPCLRQYPVLDKVIREYKGRMLLVNIDIDHEFVVTREYGITSVPTLKLFREREVVETLHGFQSEKDLKKVLDNYIARDSDAVLATAIKHYVQGDSAAAYQLIADAIVSDPENPRLPLAMCKLLKHEQRYDEAIKLIESLPAAIRQFGEITQLYNLLSFYAEVAPESDVDTLNTRIKLYPDDLDARQQLAALYAIQLQYEEALHQLVEMMDIDQSHQDNFAQKAMLKLFNIIGAGDPLVAKYRGNLRRYRH